MRANLFASATATNFGGLRSNIAASQREGLVCPFLTCLSSAVAPTISVDRIDGSPALVMPPNLIRQPVEWSLGVKPSQAAKWRPEAKFSAGGALRSTSLSQ